MVALCVTAAIQATNVFFTADQTRVDTPNGASINVFVSMMSAELFGMIFFGKSFVKEKFSTVLIAYPIFLVSVSLVIYALYRAPLIIKSLLLFSMLMLAAALWSPMVSDSGEQWVRIGKTHLAGSRYFIVLMVAMMASWLWFVTDLKKQGKIFTLAGVMCLVLYGIMIGTTDYRLKPYKDYDWKEQAKNCMAQPEGPVCEMTINPGQQWNFILCR
ncbi:MAG: hypothetical protein KC736_04205 [Candidatus Moranbacteria bacterium]|nr:hypothetical protein [Candidatus Moranbacteria bacterium]